MTNIIIISTACQSLVFGLFCAFIAQNKNRSMVGWFFLGAFFSIIALISLVGLSSREGQDRSKHQMTKSYNILIASVIFFVVASILTYEWYNLLLPRTIYSILPSPTFRLRSILEDFHTSYETISANFDKVDDNEKISIINNRILLIDQTIEQISSLNGIDSEIKLSNIASLSEIKSSCEKLKRAFYNYSIY